MVAAPLDIHNQYVTGVRTSERMTFELRPCRAAARCEALFMGVPISGTRH